MEHITLAHAPHDLRRSLLPGEIEAICERAFGPGVRVTVAHELDGGEYNTTYLLRLADAEPVILRVAPPSGAPLAWHERALMRKEVAMQPYFAPVATLMPRTVLADFTHQLIDRDYIIQTYMHGERWSDLEDQLTPIQEEALWRQFARLARAIHSVEGAAFGYPCDTAFPLWSLAVLGLLDRVIAEAEQQGLDVSDLLAVRRVAEQNRSIFDQIARASLTHGDLWPFNMLIERGPEGAHIVAVIDADRAWWCDPLADWTAHLFRMKTSPRALRQRAIFWDEYGLPDEDAPARLRALVYDGMHVGSVLSWSWRRDEQHTVVIARTKLREIVAVLADLCA